MNVITWKWDITTGGWGIKYGVLTIFVDPPTSVLKSIFLMSIIWTCYYNLITSENSKQITTSDRYANIANTKYRNISRFFVSCRNYPKYRPGGHTNTGMHIRLFVCHNVWNSVLSIIFGMRRVTVSNLIRNKIRYNFRYFKFTASFPVCQKLWFINFLPNKISLKYYPWFRINIRNIF